MPKLIKEVVCVECRKKLSAKWYEENLKKSKDALAHANSINSSSKFVQSCYSFFVSKGYLTDKQIDALNNVKSKSTFRYNDEYDDGNYERDFF